MSIKSSRVIDRPSAYFHSCYMCTKRNTHTRTLTDLLLHSYYTIINIWWFEYRLHLSPVLYLCHVNLMTSELTNLESRYMTCHQDIVVRAPFDDDLRLIGRRASFISGLVVHCIFQLPTISCDLKQEEAALLIFQPLVRGISTHLSKYANDTFWGHKPTMEPLNCPGSFQ